ncbi:MAG: DUF4260 domain-containing protein [Halobacteriaceae archaeon]
MEPRTYLKLEGLAIAVAALVLLYHLGTPWWVILLLALAPDLGMVGYLHSPRVGAVTYNLVHWYPLPLALGLAGVLLAIDPFAWAAVVWGAHIGVDRAVGYGLKYDDAFDHTHLDPAASNPGH